MTTEQIFSIAPGDLLILKWLGLYSQPESSYFIVAVDHHQTSRPVFWYYRAGDEKMSYCEIDAIAEAVKSNDVGLTIVRGSLL